MDSSSAKNPTIHEVLASISADNKSKNNTKSNKANKWSFGHSREHCNHCKEKFTLLNRRHHCRSCGLLFCGKCSRFRARLNGHQKQSRVCTNCFPKVLCGTSLPKNSFIHSKVWVPRGIFTRMLSFLSPLDLCIVSSSCRWWYKRTTLDVVWRPLYYTAFGEDGDESNDSMAKFHREVHGISFDSLPFKKRFAIRWSTKKAAKKQKNFQVMSSLLSSLGLSKYISIFQKEEIDVDSLCLMNAGHLRELGIPIGPRLKLLNAAACLADMDDDDNESDDEKKNDSNYNEEVNASAKNHHRKAKTNQSKASLVRRVQQSIVRIAVLTNDGALCNVGSGIIIHEEGIVATAHHCLVGDGFNCYNDQSFFILVAPTESTSTPPLWKYHAKLIDGCSDEELDFSLLWIEGEVISDPPSGLYIGDVTERTIARNWRIIHIKGTSFDTIDKLPALQIGNSNNMEPGDEMWMFGYPSSGHNTITIHHAICSGTDSQVYDGKKIGKALLRTAAQLDNGFSGGAAVDRKGQLVGLISFSVLRQDRVRAINMLKAYIEYAKSSLLYAKKHKK